MHHIPSIVVLLVHICDVVGPSPHVITNHGHPSHISHNTSPYISYLKISIVFPPQCQSPALHNCIVTRKKKKKKRVLIMLMYLDSWDSNVLVRSCHPSISTNLHQPKHYEGIQRLMSRVTFDIMHKQGLRRCQTVQHTTKERYKIITHYLNFQDIPTNFLRLIIE